MGDAINSVVRVPRLVPVADWDKYAAWPSVAGLRKMIFEARTNGAHAWIRRCGRRVLVDVDAFHRWIEAQSGIDSDPNSHDGDR